MMNVCLWRWVIVGTLAGTVVHADRPTVSPEIEARRQDPQSRMRTREGAETRGRALETEGAALQARRQAQQRLRESAVERPPHTLHEAAWLPRLLHQPQFAEQIGLDEEQAEALRERLMDYTDQMQALREQLQAKAAEQASLLKADPIDEAAVMQGVDELGAIQTQINRLRIGEVIFMRQTLTDEQMQRAAEIMPLRLRAQRERVLRHRQAREGDEQE